jgi:RNA polymerase sigma factor (sigma-70 family)
MTPALTTAAARQLEALFADGTLAGLSDRQLIERFVAGGDPRAAEDAFAALVARHGPMVLGVCRQLLNDRQHAEDAFQAAFLVLARRAGSVRDPDLLSGWLYGVALRTARDARKRLARMRRSEETRARQRPEACPSGSAEQSAIEQEQAEALHAEIDRLPGPFRLAVVLCYVEGLSLSEAAERLRCPPGTVHSRLDRAREKLRRGLTRRGIALSTAAIAAALASRSARASIPPLLCDATTRAAIAFAARHTIGGSAIAPAAALAREVLHTMLVHKLKAAALAVVLLAAAAGFLSIHALAHPREGEPPGEPIGKPARTEPRPPDAPRPADPVQQPAGRMTVTGRVLRPDGRPAAGVPVDIVGTSRVPEAGTDLERAAYVALGQGSTDGDGRFRVEATRSSSARFHHVYALAGAAGPGSGFGCVALRPDAEQPAAEITLRPEQVVRGRLVDVNGQPAAGVAVELRTIFWVSSLPGVGRFDCPVGGSVSVWSPSRDNPHAWPNAVSTDAQGRFTFTGIGRGLSFFLGIRDPRFAQQGFGFGPGYRDPAKEATLALEPSRIFEGRALTADTGQPIPGTVISVVSSSGVGGSMSFAKFRADDQGRFRINPYAGDYFRMRALPPAGQPYLARKTVVRWTKGAVTMSVDFTMPRGVLIRGQVTEEGTGRPVPGASVQFFPLARSGGIASDFEALVLSTDDGSFQIAVPPGKGHLTVVGPTQDYIPQEIAGNQLYGGLRPGGPRNYAHAIIAYDVKAGEGPREVHARLKPGKTVRGRLLGPAGETAKDAVILTLRQIDPTNVDWQDRDFLRAADGRFALPGFDPEKAAPAYFLDAEHEWGAAVELSGKQAGEELTIRLQPCGRARARFVGPDGKPVAGLNVLLYFHLLMTPGMPESRSQRHEQLEADWVQLQIIDDKHYADGPLTDADGRVILPDLIPGAPYRIIDRSTANVPKKDIQLRKDFTVKPGETVDLGDILVEGLGG